MDDEQKSREWRRRIRTVEDDQAEGEFPSKPAREGKDGHRTIEDWLSTRVGLTVTASLLVGRRCRLFARDLNDMPKFFAYGPGEEEKATDYWESRCSLVPTGEEGTVVHLYVDPELGERLVVKLPNGKLRKLRLDEVELVD